MRLLRWLRRIFVQQTRHCLGLSRPHLLYAETESTQLIDAGKQPVIETLPPSRHDSLQYPLEQPRTLNAPLASPFPNSLSGSKSSSPLLVGSDALTQPGLSSARSSLQPYSFGSTLSLGAISEIGARRQSSDWSSISSQSFNPPTTSPLREALAKARRERPTRRLSFFYPVDQIDRLITEDSVALELRRHQLGDFNDEQLQATARHITEFCPRIFVVLVSHRLERYIYDFINERIDDTHLPLSRLDKGGSGRLTLCSGKQAGQILQCMLEWEEYDVEKFAKAQWEVLAPIFKFSDKIKHREFNDNCILPWIEDHEHSDHTIQGGYGSVWKIKIHPAHQLVTDRSIRLPRDYCIALKELHSTDDKFFEKEVEMLTAFKRSQNPHLIKLLATFRFKGKYYLMFPYAEANLRQYWQRHPLPDFSEASVFWVLTQCKAIASALMRVHIYQSTHLPKSSSTHSSSDGHARQSKKEKLQYGRHGDIKPENILWFSDDPAISIDIHGILVIADFGLTDFHKRATRSEIPAGNITGSPTYEPPELRLHSTISRAYDIWSLGCVYLEFLTWIVCGWDALDQFPQARGQTGENVNDDTFFTISDSNKRTSVRESVREWIDDLHEKPRCSAFVHEFLNLISEEMLMGNPEDRIKIEDLDLRLKKMVVKAKKDSGYLTKPRRLNPRSQNPKPLSLAAAGKNGRLSPSLMDGSPLPVCRPSEPCAVPPSYNSPEIKPLFLANFSPPSSPRLY